MFPSLSAREFEPSAPLLPTRPNPAEVVVVVVAAAAAVVLAVVAAAAKEEVPAVAQAAGGSVAAGGSSGLERPWALISRMSSTASSLFLRPKAGWIAWRRSMACRSPFEYMPSSVFSLMTESHFSRPHSSA